MDTCTQYDLHEFMQSIVVSCCNLSPIAYISPIKSLYFILPWCRTRLMLGLRVGVCQLSLNFLQISAKPAKSITWGFQSTALLSWPSRYLKILLFTRNPFESYFIWAWFAVGRLLGQPWSLVRYRLLGVKYSALTPPCAHYNDFGHSHMLILHHIPQIKELSA
jgi:hypothetical protein